MSSFENGVSSYIHARAVVDVYFPVDSRGNAEINCRNCFFYWASSRLCRLNLEPVAFPDKYVGGSCPLLNDDDFDKFILEVNTNERD